MGASFRSMPPRLRSKTVGPARGDDDGDVDDGDGEDGGGDGDDVVVGDGGGGGGDDVGDGETSGRIAPGGPGR